MTYVEDLKDAGAVEITPREWYLRTVRIVPEDQFLQRYATAALSVLSMSMSSHKNVRMIWLHSEDVIQDKIHLGDVFKGISEYPSTTIELSIEENVTEEVQLTPGEIRLEGWDRGFPCLNVQPVADGGPPSDYFVFFVEGANI